MAIPAFRILPITMLMAGAMLAVKSFDIVQDGRTLSQSLVSDATAETKEAPKEEPAKEEAKPEEAKPEEGGHSEKAKKEAGKPTKPSPVSETPPDTVKMTGQNFTQNEVELLQNLSKRREELEQWAKDLELKENVLQATEQRIDQKLANMQSLKTQVDALLVTFNTQEDAKIKSLVKIYENMKAKDAAGIFEQTDMPVLLLLIDKMSERKVAPILAAMNPKKAMQVTAELAAQRKLQAIPPNADALAASAPTPASPAAKIPAPTAAPAAIPDAKPAAAEAKPASDPAAATKDASKEPEKAAAEKPAESKAEPEKK